MRCLLIQGLINKQKGKVGGIIGFAWPFVMLVN